VASAKHRQELDEERQHGELRQCAVSRSRRPPEELIRFVLAPDGTIVPDLARRLPGRGVWISASRRSLAQAVRQKAFARSLKQAVLVPEDLVDRVEGLLRRRLAEAVSMARKAGLLLAGFAKVEALIDQGEAELLLHAAEAAADGVAKLDRKFRVLGGSNEAIIRELTSAELSLAIGRSNVVHAAASAGGACRRIVYDANRLRQYREHGHEAAADNVSNTGRV
jgi:predicted RNA-binding protein YlxR (DUF448 family)